MPSEVKINFLNPNLSYKEDVLTLNSGTGINEDSLVIDLLGCDKAQAYWIGSYFIERNRNGLTVQVTTSQKFIDLKWGDLVNINFPKRNISGVFRVIEKKVNLDTVEFSLLYEDSAFYDGRVNDITYSYKPAKDLIPSEPPPEVSNLSYTILHSMKSDGSFLTEVELTWDYLYVWKSSFIIYLSKDGINYRSIGETYDNSFKFVISDNVPQYYVKIVPKIADNTITTTKIVNGAVTETKIYDGSITTTKISDSAITTPKIATNAIISNHISANAILLNHIASNSITLGHIQANAITADKIASGVITANHIASNAITGNHIQAGSISSGHIQSNAINAGHIQAGAISSGHIQAGAITSSHIASKTITADKLLVGNFDNLIQNPIFENDFGGWYRNRPAETSIDTTNAKFGKKCAKLNAVGAWNILYSNEVEVKEGETYYYEAWGVTDAQFNGYIGFYIKRYHVDGTVDWYSIGSLGNTSSWTKVLGKHTIPAGVYKVQFGVEVSNTATQGQALVDGFYARRVTDNPSLIADNIIATNHIQANAITADKINVAELSAITVNTGGLTVSNHIKAGKTSINDTVNSGFYLNSDGQFRLGNSNNEIYWDNSKLIVHGNLRVNSFNDLGKGYPNGLLIDMGSSASNSIALDIDVPAVGRNKGINVNMLSPAGGTATGIFVRFGIMEITE